MCHTKNVIGLFLYFFTVLLFYIFRLVYVRFSQKIEKLHFFYFKCVIIGFTWLYCIISWGFSKGNWIFVIFIMDWICFCVNSYSYIGCDVNFMFYSGIYSNLNRRVTFSSITDLGPVGCEHRCSHYIIYDLLIHWSKAILDILSRKVG